MSADAPARSTSTGMWWTGAVLTGLPALLLTMSAVMKLMQPPEVIEGMQQSGFPTYLAVWLGVVELTCTILYVIPQTSVLGAILLTGYMGGAICTHVRMEEPFFVQFAIGVVIWLGVYFRDHRLRALIPFRTRER